MLHKIRLIPGLDKQSSDTGAEGKWVNADYTRFRYGFPGQFACRIHSPKSRLPTRLLQWMPPPTVQVQAVEN